MVSLNQVIALPLDQGSQYRTGTGRTGWYVPYRYRNINVSYWFKHRPYGQFRAILGVPAGIENFFFFFLSFVIFEFLLGQNGNLFALTY